MMLGNFLKRFCGAMPMLMVTRSQVRLVLWKLNFNADLTSDQWVIGYTPDVVIAQWIGYDSTDENHYLTDASSGTASIIFSAVASSILPYTAGTEFTVENAYSQNGYDLVYSANGQTATSQSSSSDTS